MCVNRNDQGNIQPGSYPQRSDIVCIGMCIGDVTPRLVWLNIYSKKTQKVQEISLNSFLGFFHGSDLVIYGVWLITQKNEDSFMLKLFSCKAAPSSKFCGVPKKEQHLLTIIFLHYQTLNEVIWLEIPNVCFQPFRSSGKFP